MVHSSTTGFRNKHSTQSQTMRHICLSEHHPLGHQTPAHVPDHPLHTYPQPLLTPGFPYNLRCAGAHFVLNSREYFFRACRASLEMYGFDTHLLCCPGFVTCTKRPNKEEAQTAFSVEMKNHKHTPSKIKKHFDPIHALKMASRSPTFLCRRKHGNAPVEIHHELISS